MLPESSKGHLFWVQNPDGSPKWEYYVRGDDIYRASPSNVIEWGTGYRFGRWEGPNRPDYLAQILQVFQGFTIKEGR